MHPEAIRPIESYKISQFNDPFLYSVNRNVFTKKTAKNIFDDFFKETLWVEDSLYIIVGTDSGLLVDYVLEHGLPYGSRYLFIDLPQVIESIESQLSFTKWDENVAICTLDNWQEEAEKLKINAYFYTEKIKYLKSIAATDAYEPQYDELDNTLGMTLKSLHFKSAASLSRIPFVNGQFKNISESSTPLVHLKNKFLHEKCVILGGGPSLDENIEWLKANQNNIVLIAVSRISKRLISAGITPHIMISIDPHDVSFDVSKEMLNFSDVPIFIHSSYVVSSLCSQWKGARYYCGQRVPWGGECNPSNIILSGPTVTNSAISAALHLGFKSIYLTGVDLCHSAKGFTHAQGSNEAMSGPALGIKSQWVETYKGHKAETTNDFLHASIILKEQAETAESFECKLFNLSENATAVEKINYINAKDIKLTEPKFTPIFEDVIKNHPANTLNDNKELLKEIEKLNKELLEINKIATKALADNHALYKKYADEYKNAQFKLKLDKAEKKLSAKYSKTANFIKSYGIRHFIKSVQTDTEQEWSDEKMEETGRIYYQAYIDAISDIKPQIMEMKKRIKVRIEECKANADISLCMKQWLFDKQYKRALIWKEMHTEKYDLLSEEVKSQFLLCEEKHLEEMTIKDTFHAKRSQSIAKLTNIPRKIVHLYQQRNIEGLHSLAINLKSMNSEKEDTRGLSLLVSAYLASLQKEHAKALSFFQKAPEDLIKEDEILLCSALQINLNLYLDAEISMAKLCDISETYKPKFAKLLKLNQKKEKAIEVLNSYLDNNANDIAAWISLGSIYSENGDKENAIKTFEEALSIHPDSLELTQYLALFKE